MQRMVLLATVCLIGGAIPTAQSQTAADEARRAVEEGNAAARAHDVGAYGRFLSDDLMWLGNNGRLVSKAQRLKAILAPPSPRAVGDEMDVKVYGDVAVVVALATRADGSQVRLARTLVKRDGRWQLVLHAEVGVR